jgi:Uma2 family endonuclease
MDSLPKLEKYADSLLRRHFGARKSVRGIGLLKAGENANHFLHNFILRRAEQLVRARWMARRRMGIMGAAALVSLDEYLNTTYEPDMEFVDGVLVRRNVGTQQHGLLQALLASYFGRLRKSHKIEVFTATRLVVNVRLGRYRIPDVMALETPYKRGKVVKDVPAIVIEIKSPDDTFDDIVDKCFEYESLGVPNILVMDPDNKRTLVFEENALRFLSGSSVTLRLPSTTLELPFADMFAELDGE